MKRKVIRQGNGTLTITLPKKWCDAYGLSSDNEMDVEERGSLLIIGTQKEVNLDSVEIDVTGLDRSSIMCYIRSLYRRGFEEIRIKFKDPFTYHHRIKQRKRIIQVITSEVNRLVGVEIIDQKSNYCSIKDISAGSLKDFDSILRKAFLLTLDSLDNIKESSKAFDRALLQDVEDKHDAITKFVSYCLRLINKRGFSDYRKASSLYAIITFMDVIADILKYAARDMLDYGKSLRKEPIEIISSISESCRVFYELFYKFDLKGFAKLNEIRDFVLRKINGSSETMPGKELILVRDMEHILEIIREISAARLALEY